MSADLVLISGKVLTMNQSKLCAEAVAIKDCKIIKVDTNKEIEKCIGKKTKVISLKGKTVVPGFIDTHVHVIDFGRFLTWIDLSDIKSIEEIQSLLRQRAQKTPAGQWIIGHELNQFRFAEKRSPNLFDLDQASPDNPVIFYYQCGQVCLVNTMALELAGVTSWSRNPLDGEIEKNEETGELTGVLRGNATNLVWKMIPEPSEEELVDAAILALGKIVEAGITSVHWPVSSLIEIQVLQKLRSKNEVPLRVYLIIPLSLLDNVTALGSHFGVDDSVVRIGGVEIFADGYLAAKTAALLQPYSDDTATSGKLICTQEEMDSAAAKIVDAGLQIVIHAVGDKAVDAALTTIERTSREVPRNNPRYRIEQAAVLNEGLIERIKMQNVIVSLQPCVVASEFSVWSATERLGAERARWLFPINTMRRKGVRIVGGSDCPMEPLSPLLGVQAAVTRELFCEERISVSEALEMYTVHAAYSSGEESIKGSIEEGKLADLIVLSDNPIDVVPNQIAKIAVEMTIVGGIVIYSKYQ
jgi:predicted amidohydrolase YtcJ